jgi:ABC-type transport system involved in cytochrome c biogenesis permease subunit
VDWLRKIFSEPGTLAALLSSAVVGLAVGIASGLVQRKHGGWSGFWTSLAMGIAVAVIVGLGIRDYVQSETMRLALIGAAAVIADDIFAGLRAIGRLFREDPLGALGRIIDALRGKSTKPAE